jgi:hypothetical protein
LDARVAALQRVQSLTDEEVETVLGDEAALASQP